MLSKNQKILIGVGVPTLATIIVILIIGGLTQFTFQFSNKIQLIDGFNGENNSSYYQEYTDYVNSSENFKLCSSCSGYCEGGAGFCATNGQEGVGQYSCQDGDFCIPDAAVL